jgi:hypothetical protein
MPYTRSVCTGGDSPHKRIRELTKREDVSINRLIATALVEKLSAPMTVACLEERTKRGSRRKIERATAKVRDVRPEKPDEL